jgi:hypothetical protein
MKKSNLFALLHNTKNYDIETSLCLIRLQAKEQAKKRRIFVCSLNFFLSQIQKSNNKYLPVQIFNAKQIK